MSKFNWRKKKKENIEESKGHRQIKSFITGELESILGQTNQPREIDVDSLRGDDNGNLHVDMRMRIDRVDPRTIDLSTLFTHMEDAEI